MLDPMANPSMSSELSEEEGAETEEVQSSFKQRGMPKNDPEVTDEKKEMLNEYFLTRMKERVAASNSFQTRVREMRKQFFGRLNDTIY